jgi:spore coat protein A
MKTRRQFLKMGAITAGALVLPWKLSGGGQRVAASVQVPQIPLVGKTIPRFVTPLPTFVGNRVHGNSLTVTMSEFAQQVLPAGFPSTTVWGYGISNGSTTFGPLFPGFTVEAQRGTPTTVHYVNNLVDPTLQQYLSVDQTIHWADPLMEMGSFDPYSGPVPVVAHLHGGEVPSAFDGGPDSWFTPGLVYKGDGFVSDTYTYPNAQEAATLWFHDHTLGATRLNVYAGLAAFYFLRDDRDTGLPDNPIGLPAGAQEIEIAIQDRMFDTSGQLLFPDAGINPTVHPFWLPEFFGDVIVVNGTTWPYLNVEPRRYRFRFLDGSNARFYDLVLQNRGKGGRGPSFWQIGTDGGLLDIPVQLNDLLLAPGERADVIVDFAGYQGQTLTLVNGAKSPYPKGTAADPQTVGQVMEFRVGTGTITDTTYDPTAGAPLRAASIIRLADAGALATGVTADVNRLLTLNEVMGTFGPLEVLVNNTKWNGLPAGRPGSDIRETELPQVGSTEVWEIVNLTADAHPIHLHLVQFQIINRQMFNVTKYTKAYNAAFPTGAFQPAYGPPLDYGTTAKLGGNPDVTPFLQGPVNLPAPEEVGWKDTFKMYPGEVTRVVVRYAPQDAAIAGVSAGTNAYPFDPTTGPGYVWHCHIIDHEDNEMMRPYKVVS